MAGPVLSGLDPRGSSAKLLTRFGPLLPALVPGADFSDPFNLTFFCSLSMMLKMPAPTPLLRAIIFPVSGSIGRSLMMPSLLSSEPVVIVYGRLELQFTCVVMLRSPGMFQFAPVKNRCRVSDPARPHSERMS